VVQERVGHVRVLLSPRRPPRTSRLAARISARLGGLPVVSIDLVPDIAPGLDGKFRVVRSLVRSAYDDVDWSAG
jgi:hypothetical protein